MAENKINIDPKAGPVYRQLVRECSAMTAHALAHGLQVPGVIAQIVDTALAQASSSSLATGNVDSPRSGSAGTGASAPAPQLIDVQQLALVHGKLAQLVAPAKPSTILLLADEAAQQRLLLLLGPVPLIRRLMLVALLSLVALIACSISGLVDGKPDSYSLLKNSGVPLLLNELFLLSAAAVGACFAGLFQANRYIQAGTFDPTQEASYWIRLVLGLMAGMILATLVPVETFTAHGAASEAAAPSPLTGSLGGLGAPLLALLGGFSGAVVYRILFRLVSALESIVRGDPQTAVEQKLDAAKTRSEQEQVQERVDIAARLNKLQQSLASGSSPQAIAKEVESIQDRLFPPHLQDGLSLTPPPSTQNRSDAPAANPAESEPPAAKPGASETPAATTDGKNK